MKMGAIVSVLFVIGMILFGFGGIAFVQNGWDTAYLPIAGSGLLMLVVSSVIH